MMDINKFVDGQMAAWARNGLIGRLADAGHALVQTGLQVNGVRYQDVLVGPLLVKAAAALEECWKREGLIEAAAKPENPDDVVVKVTVPDRWPMTEAGHRLAAQEAAAPKPMTNGDRIRAMTDEELARSKFGEAICNLIPYEFCRVSDIECNVCKAKWLGSPAKAAAPKPMTNGDRLRAMTDAELARSRFGDNLCELIPYEFCQGSDIGCDVCKAKWLGSPAKEAAPEPSRTMADICGQEDNDGQ